MLLLHLITCGDISNEPFLEDAEYLAALPSEKRHTVDLEEPEADVMEPSLLTNTTLISHAVNGTILLLLENVETVRALPPTTRSPVQRTWGPYDRGAGLQVSAQMTRSGFGQFDWEFHGLKDREDVIFLSGTHQAGETVSAGLGDFVWDYGATAALQGEVGAGVLTVVYDNREGVDLLVDIGDWNQPGVFTGDFGYAYRLVGGAGDFQYVTSEVPEWSAEVAFYSVRTRWIVGQGGRSDAVVTGGGLAEPLEWVQCWAASGAGVYDYDTLGVTEPYGDQADCVHSDFARVDRL